MTHKNNMSEGKSAQQVRDVMTSNPKCVTEKDTVHDAARIMKDQDTGVVPVLDGKRIIGMITDRDIVVRGLAEGKDLGNTSVSDLMTRDVHSVREDALVNETLDLMGRSEIRRMPVVNGSDEIVGIISLGDISKEAGSAGNVGRAVEEISEAPPNN